MAKYVTVDCGTTNMRLYLVKDRCVSDVYKLPVGARNGIEAVRDTLKNGIAELLSRNGLSTRDVAHIIGSGMITSGYGLLCIEHLPLPIGLRELHENRIETQYPDIADIPWCLIPGIKCVNERIEDCDTVRGEETEVMGLLDDGPLAGVYVLPGSCSKHLTVDADGRIVFVRGTMTGELFRALVENTMLRGSVDFDHAVLIERFLYLGYDCCERRGFNEAVSRTGTIHKLWNSTREECYSFLLGAVLHDEVRMLLHDAKDQRIVMGGQTQLKNAIACLLRYGGHTNVCVLSEEKVAVSTALGAVKVYEYGT